MPRRTPSYDFGDRATGVVANENDWGSTGPHIARPRRVVTGTVVGLYPEAPSVVKVQTAAGDVFCIRVSGRP